MALIYARSLHSERTRTAGLWCRSSIVVGLLQWDGLDVTVLNNLRDEADDSHDRVRCISQGGSERATYRQKRGGEDIGQGRAKNVQIELGAWAEIIIIGKSAINQSTLAFNSIAHHPCILCSRNLTCVHGHPHQGHVDELTSVYRTDDHQNKDSYASPTPIGESP